jgi:hypothetical protein
MNKFKFYFIVLTASVLFFSCSKDDKGTPIAPPEDYAVQYPKDIAMIEEYLKTHYIDVVNNPGSVDDQDVTITKIPADGTQRSIMSYLNAATYPKLLVRNVKMHDLASGYNIYYLVLRPGVGDAPCNVDGVLAAYKGTYLSRSAATASPPSELTATFFEEIKFPQTYFELYTTSEVPLRAWSEIFPQFKTGTSDINTDGTVTHSDFGAGVMFIPSGLAYYNTGSTGIPAYAPLVFSFKLYSIQRLDQDYEIRAGVLIQAPDGIPSYLEDLDRDGYVYDYSNKKNYPTPPEDIIRYADDTDKDGIPDFLDVDDDGDNYTTKLEIKNPTTNLPYPFAEIPTCTSGKKIYLDGNCHP